MGAFRRAPYFALRFTRSRMRTNKATARSRPPNVIATATPPVAPQDNPNADLFPTINPRLGELDGERVGEADFEGELEIEAPKLKLAVMVFVSEHDVLNVDDADAPKLALTVILAE